jgi:hypothetical protein
MYLVVVVIVVVCVLVAVKQSPDMRVLRGLMSERQKPD